MYTCVCVYVCTYVCMYARNNTYVHTNTNQNTMLEHVTITNIARQFCWQQPDVPFQLVPLYTSSAQYHSAVTLLYWHTVQSDICTPRQSKTHTNITYNNIQKQPTALLQPPPPPCYRGHHQQHSETTHSSITAPSSSLLPGPSPTTLFYSDAPWTHIRPAQNYCSDCKLLLRHNFISC